MSENNQGAGQGGQNCPACGVKLAVLATRHPCPDLTRRYRACPRCGYKVTTEERPRLTGQPNQGIQS